MKNCIIFPPRWSVAHPYLSTPCLKAYLDRENINIDQYDLNIEEFKYFTSKDFLSICMNKITEKELDSETQLLYEMMYEYLIENIDRVKETMSDIATFLDFENYKKSRIILETFDSFLSKAFEPFMSTIDYIKFGEEVSLANIKSIINDSNSNPYIIFSEYIIKSADLQDYDFVAISVVIPDQIIPALTLCSQLKTLNPNIHICIGGSMFSKIYYKINTMEPIFDFIDSILLFEGEESLAKLIKGLENKCTLSNIENLVYKSEESIKINAIKKSNLNIENLPVPNFDGLKLDTYIAPELILPYYISRSCYWGKCSFCDHDFGHDGKFRIKTIDKVIKELKYLKEKYNTSNFYFIDEAIPPSYLENLSEQLIIEKMNIVWFTCIKASNKFSDEVCYKMKQSGCVMVNIGVESFSENVLNDMNKGITVEDINFSTRNLSANGIWVHGFLINNYPTETYEDKLKTIISVSKSNLHSVGLAEFLLSKNSKIMISKINIGVSRFKESRDFSSILEYELDGKKSNDTFDSISEIYGNRLYNKLYPNEIVLREHLPLYLKHFDLVNNAVYLKLFVKDTMFFDKSSLIYKEYSGKTLVYNLKSKKAFSCNLLLSNTLDIISNKMQVKDLRLLIKENALGIQNEIEQIINIIFCD